MTDGMVGPELSAADQAAFGTLESADLAPRVLETRRTSAHTDGPTAIVDRALGCAQEQPARLARDLPVHADDAASVRDRQSAVALADWRVDWPTFWERDRCADFLVEPIITRGRSHSLNARAEVGKSLLLQEVAFACATGRAVLHRPAGEALTVVYLDMEMTEDDLEDRADSFGYGPGDDLSRLHYVLLPNIPPLDTREGGRVLTAYVADVGAELVVIDTTARVLDGEENDADTLRDFHRHSGQPLKSAGVTWVRADHLGKDASRGARGTSAKNDDVDVVWQVTKANGGISLRAVKRRVRWVPETVNLAVVTDPHTRHQPSEALWPDGTLDAAAKLDKAGVPLEAGRPRARDMLETAGLSVGTDALRAGLRWRRQRDQEPGS